MKRYLTFDDVCLLPQHNNINSRTEPSLDTWLTKDIKVETPIIPANMDTVIGPELAQVIVKRGGIPIFHRFADLETKKKWIEEFLVSFISFGINHNDMCEIEELTDWICEVDCIRLMIDIAHAHDVRMLDRMSYIKSTWPESVIIAGNVCTADGYRDLVNAGADAVKVGIGPGAACMTREVTGFGAPQFSAIQECAEAAKKLRVPIIADGGIRNSRDCVLALAAGASTVMIGKLFALTKESAAKKRNRTRAYSEKLAGVSTGYQYQEAKYRGQASREFQEEYYGEVKKNTVPEGESFWGEVEGTADELFDKLEAGIRSGLTYGSARSIKELQRKAEFVEVTPSYIQESGVRN